MLDKALIDAIQAYLATQPVEKAWVFGSFSRGEQHEYSDLDLLVRYDRRNARVGLFTIIRIKQQLEQITGRDVDLVEEGTLMPFATASANHDKILIYKRDS